jgi:hypothetical protein
MGLSEQTERLYYMISVAVTNTAANFSGTIADRDTTGPGFLIQNWSNKYDIDLSKLVLKYWMKNEAAEQGYGLNDYLLGVHGAVESYYVKNQGLAGDPPVEFCYTYWQSITNSATNFMYVTLTAVSISNQDTAMDISFSAGLLPHNETDCNTIPPSRSQVNNNITINNISSYIDNSNYYYNPGNDWSFTNDICDYSTNKHRAGLITVYYNGQEILGQEPVETGKYDLQVDCGGFGTSNAVYDFKCDRPYNGGAWGASAYTDARYTDLQETYNARLTPEATMLIYENKYLHIKNTVPEEESIYQSVVRNYNYKYNAYVNNNNANNFARNDYSSWKDMCAFYGNDYYLVEVKQVTNYNFDNLPNGQYNVKLRFAEIDPMVTAGQDVCNVYINGAIAVNRLDVYAAAGYATKYDVDVTATVINGRLQISYEPSDELGYMAVRGCLAGIDLHLIGGTFTGMSPKWGCTFPPGPFDPAFPYLNPIYDACNGYEIPIPTFTVTPTIMPTWTLCVSATITPTVTMTAPTTCTKAWQNVGIDGFSNGIGYASNVSHQLFNGTYYAAFADTTVTNNMLSVMAFNGTQWNYVGSPGFSTGTATPVSIQLKGNDNILYVAYCMGQYVNVMKLVGSSWVYVGPQNFIQTSASLSLSLFVDGSGKPYITFQDAAYGNRCSVMKFNGTQWNYYGNPGFSQSDVYSPYIFVNGSNAYVVYGDSAQGGKATVMQSSGSTWSLVGNAGFSPDMLIPDGRQPSIYVNGDGAYIAYGTNNFNESPAVVMKCIDNVSWTTVGTVPGVSSMIGGYISLRVYNGQPYISFFDGFSGNEMVVYKYDGSNWGVLGGPYYSFTTTNFVYPDVMEIDSNTGDVSVVYIGNGEKVSLKKYSCGLAPSTPTITSTITPTSTPTACTKAWNTVGNNYFSAGGASSSSLYINNGTPFVAYGDFANSGATVMTYTGVSWTAVGNAGFSKGEVNYTSLNIYNGTPFVAYEDLYNNSKATVMTYTGVSWTAVGNAAFSAGEADYTSLYVYNGTPYVAYMDIGSSEKATVMEYNGNNWINVGNAGFSAGIASNTSLYVYNGTPYVAYVDNGYGSKATVMTYNGVSWTAVGNAGFSDGATQFTSLKVYNGKPFVAYQDAAHSNYATVMTYNGVSWTAVGNVGFSNSVVNYTSLFVDNGTLYIAYTDIANSSKATVMMFDGNNWVYIGSAGFSVDSTADISLYVYNGIPYVSYENPNNNFKMTVMKFDCP